MRDDQTPDTDGSDAVEQSRKERGTSMVEYALLLALVVIVCVGSLNFVSCSMKVSFSSISNSMANPNP